MTTLVRYPGYTRAEHSALPRMQGILRVASLLSWALILCLAAPAMGQSAVPAGQPPLVALASSFRALWPSLMHAYQQETAAALPRTSFASSGLLSTQIRHGAPFELFLSADPTMVEKLQAAGLTQGIGVPLANGAVSLISLSSPDSVTQDSGVAGLSLNELANRLRQSEPFKIAMPNPRHAPYGVAARQALDHVGLWPLPQGYLLNAENAAQSLQFALSGAVDYAFVPTTLVIQPPAGVRVSALDPDSYEPVLHQMVLLRTAGKPAMALYDWLRGASASAVLQRFGLTPINGKP